MGDVEALAEVLMDALCGSVIWQDRHIGELEYHLCDGIAEAILASPWLAAHVAAARAEGVRAFVRHIASQRAYNGAPDEGQMFYNECLNPWLDDAAERYLAVRAAVASLPTREDLRPREGA